MGILLCVKVLIILFLTLKSVATKDEGANQNFQERLIFTGAIRKSEQKCWEYTKAIADEIVPSQGIYCDPLTIGMTESDYGGIHITVVGGTRAIREEFPFMAAIGFENSEDQPEWRCGGTLISEHWVLTAGHCTYSVDGGSPKWLRLGALEMSKNRECGRADYLIDNVVVHPEYKYTQKYNDIALLGTSKQIQFSKNVRPACLFTHSHISTKYATAIGWGQTNFAGPNSDKLLKVKLNIYDNTYCSEAFDRDIKSNISQISKGIVDTMLCAGELGGGKDTCLGDSGGPLFITEYGNSHKFYVVGVTSFGKLCGEKNVPAIYTRVSKYIQWIENTIWR